MLTAYDYGVREKYGRGVERVTIWYDQLNFAELFTQRSDADRMRFVDYMRDTIVSILNTPEEDVANTPKLNRWCAWCPLLADCGIVEVATDFQKSVMGHLNKNLEYHDLTEYVKMYEKSKDAIKALEAFNKKMSAELKLSPGAYGDKNYVKSYVKKFEWRATDLVRIFGDDAFDMLPGVSAKRIGKERMAEAAAELDRCKVSAGGYERLVAKDGSPKEDPD